VCYTNVFTYLLSYLLKHQKTGVCNRTPEESTVAKDAALNWRPY